MTQDITLRQVGSAMRESEPRAEIIPGDHAGAETLELLAEAPQYIDAIWQGLCDPSRLCGARRQVFRRDGLRVVLL